MSKVAAAARSDAAAAEAAAARRAARGGCVFALLVFALFLLAPACAAPHRQKRVSDQRLAELETRVALNRLKGIVVTVPVGFGKVDPDKLGRRRRSEEEALAAGMGAGGGDAAAEGPEGEAEGEEMVGVDEAAEGSLGRLSLAQLIRALQMQQRLAQQQRPPPHWRLGLQMK